MFRKQSSMSTGRYQNLPVLESPDVFVLGAGFSHAISDSMPLMRDLGCRVATNQPEYQRIAELFGGDVELAMTFLVQDQPWLAESDRLRNRAVFLEISRKVASVIDEATEEVLSHPCPEWLVRFVHYLHDCRCTVITLNYDTLLERAFRAIELGQDPLGRPNCYLDARALFPIALQAPGLGFLRPLSATVLKLHGSTNWFYSGRSEYFGEPVCYRHLIGWSRDDQFGRPPQLAGRLPLIVPPVADKLGYFQNEAVQHLWARARNALLRCSEGSGRLFLVGYSLPATDLTMRFLLNGAIQPTGQGELRLIPVNVSKEVSHHLRRLLPSCYTIDQGFFGEHAVEEMVDFLLQEQRKFFASLEASQQGTVQQRIRATIRPHQQLHVPGRDECFSVDAFFGLGILLSCGAASVKTFVPWDCLEELMLKLSQIRPPCVFGKHDPDYLGEPRSIEDRLTSWCTRPWRPG